jgi:cysteine desulfurase
MFRDEETLEPHVYFCKMPKDVADRDIIIVDPMLATGGSADAAITEMKKRGCHNIKLMVLVAAPEGIEHLQKVHSDAVAAFGHIDVDVKKLGVDFLNVSGHKICGPKGVGFLYVRGGKPERFMHGGGQENGLRAGTENVAGIAGLATAARIAYETLSDRARQEKKISDYMIKRILREIPYSRLNGSREIRVTGNMNFSFQYVNGGMLVVMLNKQGICASAGSACTSNSGKPSHVLLALGLDEKIAEGSLRLTINHTITHREADYVVECIKKDVARLRELA